MTTESGRHRQRRLGVAAGVGAVLAACALFGSAAAPKVGRLNPADRDLPFDVTADKLNYDRGREEVEAVGHVVIRRGAEEMRADHVRFNQVTQQAVASGNVTLKRGGETWRGQKMEYNFKTETGSADSMHMNSETFRILSSGKGQKKAGDLYVLNDAQVTTCTNDAEHCHYHLRMRELDVVPEDYAQGWRGIWYFGHVPVMWIPYWYRELDGDFGYRVYPGYDSRMGAFLLTSCRYRLNSMTQGRTHLDLRSKRGVGLGQDFMWTEPPGWVRGRGDLSLYYIDDQKPLDNDDKPTDGIDSSRYRIRFRDDYWFGDADHVLLQANYLSDEDILEDFFESEYRGAAEPDNYLTYNHAESLYSWGVRVRARLNDFYTTIDRVPEVYLDVSRQELGDSWVYYESQTAAAILAKRWDEGVTNAEDYSSFRFDTRHMFYRPEKYFGFLTVIPRAGIRGTYYSETRRQETTTAVVPFTKTNMVTDAAGRAYPVVTSGIETNTTTTDVDNGSGFRAMPEFGVETSFKLFKTWEGFDAQYRHIVEPYANYTLIPEPNLTPDDLYQFDDVDRLDTRHEVKLGVRNELQSRSDTAARTLADVDLYTLCQFERPDDESLFERLYGLVELRPAGWLYSRIDGIWNLQESTMEQMNTRLTYAGGDLRLAVEHRYRDQQSSLLIGSVEMFPKGPWTYSAHARHEFEDSRLEEVGGYVQRNLDCMSVRCGLNYMPGYTRTDGTEQKDEYRIILAFWLTAFPETSLSTDHMK